jgi:hypothetical protein
LETVVLVTCKKSCAIFNHYNYKILFFRALDDTEITHSRCKFEDECDFESDLCQFENVVDVNYYTWTRGRNGTDTLGTGPSIDHTLGTQYGYYLFIETSNPKKEGDRYLLQSASYKADRDRCLKFWVCRNI